MHDVSMPEGATAPGHQLKLSMAEFIAMAASLAAVAAMSIDILLPALPAIGQSFGVADPNSRQLVILIYVVTFSVSQLFFGLLTDRYGRRPFLIFGLALYLAAAWRRCSQPVSRRCSPCASSRASAPPLCRWW